MTTDEKHGTHLAANLKLLRRLKHISQNALAELLGIKRNAVASYEAGFSEPRLSVLISLSEFFEVSIDDLLSKDPTEMGLEMIISTSEIDSNKIASPVVEDLKTFLDATNDTQKIVDGFVAFKRFIDTKEEQLAENHEVARMRLILNSILKNNWSLLKHFENKNK